MFWGKKKKVKVKEEQRDFDELWKDILLPALKKFEDDIHEPLNSFFKNLENDNKIILNAHQEVLFHLSLYIPKMLSAEDKKIEIDNLLMLHRAIELRMDELLKKTGTKTKTKVSKDRPEYFG